MKHLVFKMLVPVTAAVAALGLWAMWGTRIRFTLRWIRLPLAFVAI